MKMIKETVVLSLLLTLAGGFTTAAQADDQPATPAPPAAPAPPTPEPAVPTETPTAPSTPTPKKPVQQQLSGKVVAVDKFSRTITLQVNDLSYVLQVADGTRIGRDDKEATLNDVVVGQQISVNVVLRELPNGRVEVAVLNVNLTESEEAQGRGRDHGGSKFNRPPPFRHGPNPGNVDGPVISPHR